MECKNCQTELHENHKFCPNCGQKVIEKLNLKYVLGEFLDNLFNWDSKFFKTLKYLTLKPGKLSKEYIEGRRASFVPPIRFYVLMSVIFFFCLSLVDYGEGTNVGFNTGNNVSASVGNNVRTSDSTIVDGVTFTVNGENIVIPTKDLRRMEYEGRLDEGLDSLTADMQPFAGYVSKKMSKAKLKGEGFTDILTDQFSVFLLLFLPFFALLYATLFSRNKRGFIPHLIFNLHLNSFIMLSLLIHMIGDYLFGGFSNLLDLLWFVGIAFYGQYYLIKAVMVFYDRKWWAALYKYFLLIFGYVVLAIVFMIVVLGSSIFLV